MKKLATTFIAAMAMLALASPLYAAGEKKMTEQAGTAQSMSPEELKGMQVVSQTGEELGEIADVKTDEQSGQIQFVTISKGGVLGMGGEDIAVPLEAFRIDQESDRATLTVDQSKLDNAPQQADKSNQEFQRELESHYGVSPAWEQDTQMDQPSMDQTQEPGIEPPSMDQTQQPGMEPDSPQMQDPETAPKTN
jgi:sporulation protein YlmC with PRC-barrel domain